MNYREAELYAKQEISTIYEPEEAAVMAGMLLEHVTNLDRSSRMVKDKLLTSEQHQELDAALARLKQHEPIQYVIGEAWFADMKLYVNSSVLIPRPETEELVHWIIEDVKKERLPVFERKAAEADLTPDLKIIDIGTGSGCIALSLKKAMPLAEVWGCDISDEALNVARRNGSQLDIRVDFQHVNFLDIAQQKHLPSVDIVVSNPPYVPQKDKASMHPNVLNYEPHTALFVPDNDALVFYKALVDFSKHRLHSDGRIYMEIHEDLGKDVVSLFEEAGFDVEIRKDMQGKDRMVRAERILNKEQGTRNDE